MSKVTEVTRNPVWFVFIAMTIAGTTAEQLGIVHFLAKLCLYWVQFWRGIWTRTFGWLSQWIHVDLALHQMDLLTLGVLVVATLGVLPLATSMTANADRQPPNLAIDILTERKVPKYLARNILVFLTCLALLVIFLPFADALITALTDNARDEEYQKYMRDRILAIEANARPPIWDRVELWLIRNLHWVSPSSIIIGGISAGIQWYNKPRYSLILFSSVVVIAFMANHFRGVHEPFSLFLISQGILLFVLTLFVYSLKRSALPFIYIALFVSIILGLDWVLVQLQDIWLTVT